MSAVATAVSVVKEEWGEHERKWAMNRQAMFGGSAVYTYLVPFWVKVVVNDVSFVLYA